jgi:hypothetical protein
VLYRFPDLIECHCVVSAVHKPGARNGIEILREAVLEAATAMARTHAEQACERALRAKLAALRGGGVRRIAWTEYAALAAALAITHDALLDVTRSLRCTGDVMWFETPSLRNMVILDVQFVADALRTVVTFRHSFVHEGVVSDADLRAALPPSLTPERARRGDVAARALRRALPTAECATDAGVARAVPTADGARAGARGGARRAAPHMDARLALRRVAAGVVHAAHRDARAAHDRRRRGAVAVGERRRAALPRRQPRAGAARHTARRVRRRALRRSDAAADGARAAARARAARVVGAGGAAVAAAAGAAAARGALCRAGDRSV